MNLKIWINVKTALLFILEKESNQWRVFSLSPFLGETSGSLIVIQSTYPGTSLCMFFSQKPKKKKKGSEEATVYIETLI